jgi:hypothetical protein
MVGGLDAPRGFEFTQQIARRQRHDPLRQRTHEAPLSHVGVFENKNSLEIGIVGHSGVENFKRGLLATPPGPCPRIDRTQGLEFGEDGGRNDLNLSVMLARPLHHVVRAQPRKILRDFSIHHIGDDHGHTRHRQTFQGFAGGQGDQRRGVGDNKPETARQGAALRAARMKARPRSRASRLGPSIGAIGGRNPRAPSAASTSA